MSLSKSNKLINLLNYRLRVTLVDQRVLTVISDCEEFRKTTPKGSKEEIELKRTLGLVILRGEHIVSISVDGPPPLSSESLKARVAQLAAGSGVGRPAGRGIPIAPSENAPASGLTGPARGLGAPAPSMMQPRVPATSAAPIPYARPIPPGSNMAARPGMPMAPMGFRPGMPPPPGFHPGMPLPSGVRPPPGGMPPPFPPGPMGHPGGPMPPGMQRPNFNAPPPQGFRPPPGPGGPPPPRG